MKTKRVFLILTLAVVSGAVAGYSALRYLRDRPATLTAAGAPTASTPVVIAVRDVGLGEILTDDDMQVVDWPGAAVPAGYARSVAEVAGRGVISDIRTNEPILSSKLADAAAGGGLPPLIPPGMRAMSVRVDDVIGVAGFVTPQTRVDVILTVTPPGSQDPISKVILQNVQALAAGTDVQRNEQGEPMEVTVVTLLVDPEEAEALALSSTQGRIQMALRNMMDLETVETRGERIAGLLSGTARPGRATVRVGTTGPASTPGIIEMYQGGVRTLISY
ncbi:MAG: Flp pilus assembly protein CpaB [Gemmatimonadetes bacterium]|nr:Flp pilus assembly protein CpaB [Gemmatimonadota bacterium]